MAENPESIIKRLLRESEEVKITLETYASQDSVTDNPARDNVSGEYEAQKSTGHTNAKDVRIIAVVTHLDSATGDEQAWFVSTFIYLCAFVFAGYCSQCPPHIFKPIT